MVTPGSVRRAKQKAVGGRKDRCTKGKSCSATCIYAAKICLVDLPDSVAASMGQLVKLVRSSFKGISKRAEKVVPGLRGPYLASRREKFDTLQKTLIKQIERASLRNDQDKVKSLETKLSRLQSSIGVKLKAPIKNPGLSEREISDRRARYYNAKDSIIEKISEAATQGRYGTYKKWENALLTLEKKAASKFGDTDLTKPGDGWKFTSIERKNFRSNNYLSHVDQQQKKVYAAAQEGDFQRYRKAEDALIKMERGAGKKLGYGPETTKNRIWREIKEKSFDRIEDTHDKVTRAIMKSIVKGDRAKYDKLERILRRIERNPELSSAKARLYEENGKIWKYFKGVANFAERLEKGGIQDGVKGVSSIKLQPQSRIALYIKSKIKGNVLNLQIYPDSFSFTVNDRHTVVGDLPMREKIPIVKEIKRQFDIVIKNIGDSVLSVSAARADGQQNMREQAYKEAGFSEPDSAGSMFGRIINGRMTPATKEEYLEEYLDNFS